VSLVVPAFEVLSDPREVVCAEGKLSLSFPIFNSCLYQPCCPVNNFVHTVSEEVNNVMMSAKYKLVDLCRQEEKEVVQPVKSLWDTIEHRIDNFSTYGFHNFLFLQ